MTGTLLTTLEVAERLGLSSAAVAQAVRTGALEPAARTSDDFLFTEREVAAFAERRVAAAATPLSPPAPGLRSEWSGDVERLNNWLKELTEALPAPARGASAGPETAPPIAEVAADDLQPPAVPAVPPAQQSPARAGSGSILGRIAAAQHAASGQAPTSPPAPPAERPTEPEQKESIPASELADPTPEPVTPAVVTVPEPIVPVDWPDPEPAAATVVVEPTRSQEEPLPAPTPPPPPDPALPAQTATDRALPVSDLSRQSLLVVQPIVRFRVLREVAERLASVPGVADARLERLEGGVASYRLSFDGERPDEAAIGGVLAALNLEAMLVDSFL